VAAPLGLAACSSGSSGDGNEASPDEPSLPARPSPGEPRPGPGPIRFVDVATQAGLDFRQGAFRWGMTPDPVPMTGSGV
jgi:hypothetical protein